MNNESSLQSKYFDLHSFTIYNVRFPFLQNNVKKCLFSDKSSSSDPSSSNTEASTSQEGFGLDPDFITRVATKVTEELNRQKRNSEEAETRPIVSNYPAYDRSQPYMSSSVIPAKTLPPVSFDQQRFPNEMSDDFDQKRLLRKVPKNFKIQASNLLKQFEERANELTWDSSGVVYIDQQSIPNSDIFDIFPRLFQKRHPKRIIGFQDFYQKVKSMGLAHLIVLPKVSATSTIKIEKKNPSLIFKRQDELQWWYIGD